MKSTWMVKGAMVCLAILGVCQWAAAAKPVAVDVALRDGGVLVGQVVDSQGAGIEGVPVAIRSQDQQWVNAKTGKEGYFAFKDLRGGVYQVASADGQGVYRAWTPGTAPPAAQEGALVVAGEDVIRGQNCQPGCQPGCQPACDPCQPGHPRLRRFITNPLVIGGAVATAIAVPIAIHESKDDSIPVSPN
jgi:hypothetical protein